MAGVNPTTEREAFEAAIFKPPFLARMLERCGRFTDGLDDKDAFLTKAFDYFWVLRGQIKTSGDVLRYWDDALRAASVSRSRWWVHYGSVLEKGKWVQGRRLGRHL